MECSENIQSFSPRKCSENFSIQTFSLRGKVLKLKIEKSGKTVAAIQKHNPKLIK